MSPDVFIAVTTSSDSGFRYIFSMNSGEELTMRLATAPRISKMFWRALIVYAYFAADLSIADDEHTLGSSSS